MSAVKKRPQQYAFGRNASVYVPAGVLRAGADVQEPKALGALDDGAGLVGDQPGGDAAKSWHGTAASSCHITGSSQRSQASPREPHCEPLQAPEVELQPLAQGFQLSDAPLSPAEESLFVSVGAEKRARAGDAAPHLQALPDYGGHARQSVPGWLPNAPWVRVLRLIWLPAVSVFSIYFVTLLIFPGFLSEDVASASLGSWFPVLLFLTYNISDFASRSFQPPPSWLLPLCLSRILFVPLFAMCSFQVVPTAGIFLLTAVFGCSNGSLTAAAFVRASLAAGPLHDGLAGSVMVLCLMTGLWLGSCASWLWLLVHR